MCDSEGGGAGKTDNSVPGLKHREDVEKLNMDRSSELGLLHSPVQFELGLIKGSAAQSPQASHETARRAPSVSCEDHSPRCDSLS